MFQSLLKAGSWLDGMIDFAFPPLCTGCGQFWDALVPVCDICRESILMSEGPVCLGCFGPLNTEGACSHCKSPSLPLLAFGRYHNPLDRMIIEFKFRGVTSLAPYFAQNIYDKCADMIEKWKPEIIIPVPLHRRRETERGYNQATLIAAELSKLTGLPLDEDILVRTKSMRPQAKMGMSSREKNVRGVFAVLRPTTGSERVLLVDDVVTSGSTAREAGTELRKNGYLPSAVVAVAQA